MPRHMLALPTAQPQMRRRKTMPTLAQPLTSLVGRKREVADALRLLRHKHVRLLTLTGPPGVGKTRLCIEIAYKVAGSFDDSVFFVPLAPISDPGLVASSIAQALNIRPANRGDVLSTLREHLQDKHALLILDNFEQVIEAGSLVFDLLQGCSQLTVIVTSREPLHISGEQEFAVFPLQLPGSEYRVASASALPGAGYSTLGTVESVALFVQRAKSVKPDFELDAGNASTIAEICTRLDGLPLAIELAAARIKTLPPRVILERLEHRLHLLVGGAHDLPARQQTLRDAVDWSFSLLSADEQVLLARMAIFVGGCSLPAIENVCNYDSSLGSDVLALATSLADKSLVMPTEAGGEVRFRMLETIREFGLENLHLRGEVEELRSQHAHYFTLLVDNACLISLTPIKRCGLTGWPRKTAICAPYFHGASAPITASTEWREATGNEQDTAAQGSRSASIWRPNWLGSGTGKAISTRDAHGWKRLLQSQPPTPIRRTQPIPTPAN